MEKEVKDRHEGHEEGTEEPTVAENMKMQENGRRKYLLLPPAELQMERKLFRDVWRQKSGATICITIRGVQDDISLYCE